eukprot:12918942-Prorocentrum_lima.AAC.1
MDAAQLAFKLGDILRYLVSHDRCRNIGPRQVARSFRRRLPSRIVRKRLNIEMACTVRRHRTTESCKE